MVSVAVTKDICTEYEQNWINTKFSQWLLPFIGSNNQSYRYTVPQWKQSQVPGYNDGESKRRYTIYTLLTKSQVDSLYFQGYVP